MYIYIYINFFIKCIFHLKIVEQGYMLLVSDNEDCSKELAWQFHFSGSTCRAHNVIYNMNRQIIKVAYIENCDFKHRKEAAIELSEFLE